MNIMRLLNSIILVSALGAIDMPDYSKARFDGMVRWVDTENTKTGWLYAYADDAQRYYVSYLDCDKIALLPYAIMVANDIGSALYVDSNYDGVADLVKVGIDNRNIGDFSPDCNNE